MKKNNRQQYLKTWLTYLKGKTQLDPKALADFLGKTLKGALAPITMKRYTATVIGNLYENGFLAGKTGKKFTGEPLEIVQEITLPVLDKCLTSNYKKVKFTETDQVAEAVEPVTEPRRPRSQGKQQPKRRRPRNRLKPKPENRSAGNQVPRRRKLRRNPRKKYSQKSRKSLARNLGGGLPLKKYSVKSR